MEKTGWLALLVFGIGDAALAQNTSSLPPVEGAAPRLSLDPLVRQIGIRASVNARYESNIFGVSDALAARGAIDREDRDDYVISPSLQLDFQLPVGARQSVFLRGQVGYDFHLRNEDLNRERINLGAGANLALSSCSASVNASYGRFRTDPGDLFIVAPGTIASRRNAVTSRAYGVQARCGAAIGLTPSFGYQHVETRNSEPLLQFNDANQDTFDASIGYQRPSLGRISIYGSYSEGEYLGRDVDFDPRLLLLNGAFVPNPAFNRNALDGLENYSAGVRFERNIGSRINGSVSIGYSWANPKSPLSRKFSGSSYSANLSVRPTNRLSVDLLASRSANLSNTVFTTFNVTELYSLNASYTLSERLRLNIGISKQFRDFRLAAPVVDRTAFVSEDSFTRIYGGLNFNLNRRVTLNGLVSHQRRQSDNDLINFKNTTVSLGASLALGRR